VQWSTTIWPPRNSRCCVRGGPRIVTIVTVVDFSGEMCYAVLSLSCTNTAVVATTASLQVTQVTDTQSKCVRPRIVARPTRSQLPRFSQLRVILKTQIVKTLRWTSRRRVKTLESAGREPVNLRVIFESFAVEPRRKILGPFPLPEVLIP
jgi:hypothetical protein